MSWSILYTECAPHTKFNSVRFVSYAEGAHGGVTRDDPRAADVLVNKLVSCAIAELGRRVRGVAVALLSLARDLELVDAGAVYDQLVEGRAGRIRVKHGTRSTIAPSPMP